MYIAERLVSIKSHKTVQVTFVPILFLSNVMLMEECNSVDWLFGTSFDCGACMEPVSQLMEQLPLKSLVLQCNSTVAVPPGASVGRAGFDFRLTVVGGSKHS